MRFLAWRGLPLRRHGDWEIQIENDSNFVQLVKLWGENDFRIISWLKKKTDKYTSSDMENEMLKPWLFKFFVKQLNQFL